MDESSEKHWRELSEEILTDIKDGDEVTPKRHAREIEDEVHARMSRGRAQMDSGDTASRARAENGVDKQTRASHLPVCQTPLQSEGNGNANCKEREGRM